MPPGYQTSNDATNDASDEEGSVGDSDTNSISSVEELDGVEEWGDALVHDFNDIEDASGLAPLPPNTSTDSSQFLGAVDYVDESIEYVANNKNNTAGVHVLLATLAEINSKRQSGAQWVRDFVGNVTSKFPNLPDPAEYLEAFLHVAHFPVFDRTTGHYPGCMPLRMYSSHTHKGKSNPYVPFEEYVLNVLHDYASTRTYDATWVGYAFNVLLMRLIESGGNLDVVRRGYANALDKRGSQAEYMDKYGDRVLTNMMYDAAQARKNVDGLCAAIQKFGMPTYFLTFTCDMTKFPGVREVYEAIEREGHDVRYFQVHLQRVWYRSTNLFLRYLQEDPTQPLGEILHVWMHREFQTDVGNFNHCHAMIITKDRVSDADMAIRQKALDDALRRITAQVMGAFHHLGDQTATGHVGVFPTQETLWEQRARDVQAHKCVKKCQIPDGNDSTKCRFNAPWKTHDAPTFSPLDVTIPEGLKDLLVHHGVAHTNEAGKVFLHDDLCGGVYDPPRGREDSRRSPFSGPIFEAIGGSHMNVQVIYGSRWVLSYLVKYLSSEEERCLVKVTQQDGSVAKVTKVDERKRKRKEGVDLKGKQFNGKSISECEVVFHALGLNSVYSTFDAIHINTGAPEQRFVSLRRRWDPADPPKPLFGPNAAGDGTRCGPGYPEREVVGDQLKSYHAWFHSRFTADRVQQYCLRPPELLDLRLRAFFEHTIAVPTTLPNNEARRQQRIRDWRQFGLYDLRLHRVYLLPEFFEDEATARSIFVHRLGATAAEFLELKLAARNPTAPHPGWMDAIVVWNAKPRVLVTIPTLPEPKLVYRPGFENSRTVFKRAGAFSFVPAKFVLAYHACVCLTFAQEF